MVGESTEKIWSNFSWSSFEKNNLKDVLKSFGGEKSVVIKFLGQTFNILLKIYFQ